MGPPGPPPRGGGGGAPRRGGGAPRKPRPPPPPGRAPARRRPPPPPARRPRRRRHATRPGARRQVPAVHETVLRRTPAGRWGTMEDMAGVAVFLASAASDFVTGTAIPVDGGYSVLG